MNEAIKIVVMEGYTPNTYIQSTIKKLPVFWELCLTESANGTMLDLRLVG